MGDQLEELETFSEQLEEGGRPDVNCCQYAKIGLEHSSTMTLEAKLAYDEVLRVIASALEIYHKENANPTFNQEGGVDTTRKPHIEKYTFYPGIVGNQVEDIHQGIHVDMQMGMEMPSYFDACQGKKVPAEESIDYGWVLHLPLCRQGMRVRMLIPNFEQKKWEMRYIEVPFGACCCCGLTFGILVSTLGQAERHTMESACLHIRATISITSVISRNSFLKHPLGK